MNGTKGLIIAGTRSGCGKTSTCLALMSAFIRRGLTVQGCKVGPDFIDPGHHQSITGRPSYNLDARMNGRPGLLDNFARALRREPQADILLIEGVMGLFDGAAAAAPLPFCVSYADRVPAPPFGNAGAHVRRAGPVNEDLAGGSTAETALLLNLPVLLLLDVRGMAQSVAALAQGFICRMPESALLGLACTGVGGPNHKDMLREALQDCPVPLLGLLPKNGAPHLPSRHLGLVTAQEAPLSPFARQRAAEWIEEHLDVDGLLQRMPVIAQRGSALCTGLSGGAAPEDGRRRASESAGAVQSQNPPQTHDTFLFRAAKSRHRASPAVAIAHDAAFCFLYPELPEILEDIGARTLFFSPLEDAGLPKAEIVYLPGGYPELFAGRLAANVSMREALRSFAASGGIVYGECGGYIYLMEEILVRGETWPMSGCLPLRCVLEEERAALGYRDLRPANPSPLSPSGEERGRGHEYHYARITHRPPLPALWNLRDRSGRELGDEGVLLGATAGSWVHLAPYGSRLLWRNLLRSGEKHA